MVSLDASALTSLFVEDAHTPVMDAFLARGAEPVGVSTFAAAECAAAIGRRVRTREFEARDAERIVARLDRWLATTPEILEVEPADPRAAGDLTRRFALGLSAADALHVAVCRRLGLALLTFDRRQAAAAAALGVACDPAGETGTA